MIGNYSKDILPIEEYDDTSFFANSDVIDIDNQELSKFIDSILPDMYIKKEKNDYYDSQPQTFYYPLKQSKDDDDTQIYKTLFDEIEQEEKNKAEVNTQISTIASKDLSINTPIFKVENGNVVVSGEVK